MIPFLLFFLGWLLLGFAGIRINNRFIPGDHINEWDAPVWVWCGAFLFIVVVGEVILSSWGERLSPYRNKVGQWITGRKVDKYRDW